MNNEVDQKTFSRRSVLKTSLLGGAMVAPLLSSLPFVGNAASKIEAKSNENPDEPETFGPFKYRFRDSEKRTLKEGWAREATVKQFPVSVGLAGVDMVLNPGAIRELHWHAIAAEWGYVLEGGVRVTTVDPEGRTDVQDCGVGDVFFFPRGYGHSIQAFEKGTHFILIFDSGHFSEFGTFSSTDWVTHTPMDVLTASTGMSASFFKGMDAKEYYMLPAEAPKGTPNTNKESATPNIHKYSFLSSKPSHDTPGGSVRIASAKEFPISETMTGVLEIIKPGAARELHWHPNADEWQYYIKGKGKMTVFGSHSRAHTDDFDATDVGYVPRGYGHYIENTGTEDLWVLIGLNSGKYEDISMSDWMANNTPELLAAHFKGSVEEWRKNKPTEKLFFGFPKNK